MASDAYMISGSGRQRLVAAADVADYQANGWQILRLIEVEKAPEKARTEETGAS